MKRSGSAIAVVFLAIVGLSFLHPFGNPRLVPQKGLDALLQGAEIPADAKRTLISKCADCHSDETRWPVYARIAPGLWLIERDIAEGRAKMNLSRWNEMPADERDVLIAKMIHEANGGEMPPLQYRALHWAARLTAADLAAIRSMSKFAQGAGEASSTAGDAARGKLIFERRCTGCHAMEADREGPRLAGVFGRRAGSVPGYDYSAGLRNSGVTWNEATLVKWLADPDTIAADTKMDFHLPKAQERADLIAYLKR